MGKLVAPVASVFGIGQKDDPTFYNKQERQAKYDKFLDEAHPEIEGVAGSKMASEQVRSDPLSSGLFGAGGLQDRLGTEEQDLASRGYSLKPEDREAYGQAAGDIARMYGQQEQAGAASLARRGLGAGNSGAAGAMFSGLQGGKNEQLARAQTDIAQKRMADTQQRLQSTRSMMSQLGQQGQNALQNQYGRQLGGYQAKAGGMQQSVQNEQAANQQGRQANEDAIGHKSKNLGDAWAGGTYSGLQSGTADATASWAKMGGTSSMGFSDERLKKNVGDGSGTMNSFLSSLPPPKSGGESSGGGGGGLSGLTSLFGGGGGGGEAAGGAGGAEGLGSMMSMFSDRNEKKNVQDGDPELRLFMNSIKPHEYEYKDEVKDSPLGGEGTYVSPMAQELEKTELGSSMVKDTPDGKVVDYGKGFGTMLAAVADLNNRLNRQEGKK